MTCAERTDSIFLYAAEQLEPAEADEIRAHLAGGCPTCAGALAEAEAIAAQLATAIDPTPPPPSARIRLMSKVRAEMRAREIGQLARSGRMRIWGAAAFAAAAAVAITSLVFVYLTTPARTFFRSQDLQTVALTSETQPQARGQVLWDRQTGQWRVAVFGLQPPPPGREYELWFITPDGNKIPSKTFNVDAKGDAMVMVSVPRDIGTISVTAITDEPQGGVSSPTGKIHLLGKVPGA